MCLKVIEVDYSRRHDRNLCKTVVAMWDVASLHRKHDCCAGDPVTGRRELQITAGLRRVENMEAVE